jgi:hypothetical protein
LDFVDISDQMMGEKFRVEVIALSKDIHSRRGYVFEEDYSTPHVKTVRKTGP